MNFINKLLTFYNNFLEVGEIGLKDTGPSQVGRKY